MTNINPFIPELCVQNLYTELQPAIQSAITQRASITETKTLYHVVPYEIKNKSRCSITP